MEFQFVLGEKSRNNDVEYHIREAVRAIILIGTRTLMLVNNKGDYKFPGGGVEDEESHHEALRREVEEETGYSLSSIIREIGTTIERRPDIYMENVGFEMQSTYYICDISDRHVGQNLSKYEEALEFKAEWIEMEYALNNNKLLLKSNNDINPWVMREVKVLGYLFEKFLKDR